MSSRLLLTPLLALLAVSACARNARPSRVGIEHVTAPEPANRTGSATAQQNSPAYPPSQAQALAAQTPAAPTTGSSSASDQAQPIFNEQIVAIVDAFYAGRIALAQQALWRASDPGVRHLAERLLLQHVHARDHLSRLGVTRSHSDLSFSLLRKAGNDLMRLRAMEGSDYDKAWTALSIVDSQNFSHLLTTTLIPSATQPMLDLQLRHLVPQYAADTRDQVRVHANLAIPLDEQRALQREAAAATVVSPASRARAQGGNPRDTPPAPAPAPEAPPGDGNHGTPAGQVPPP